MKKIGKISALKREYNSSQLKTMTSELANKGLTRVPGTGVTKLPYKELDGKYRTGLDPDAAYIKRIKDPVEREIEQKRVTELRDRLSKQLNIVDLSPTSKFWNYSLSSSANDNSHVQPEKLVDGDNYYDLSVPWRELAYSWLRVHPTIASSFQAWQRAEYPADTQFYVADQDIETDIAYKKKKIVNEAIVKLSNMSPTKRKKVARVMGLAVTDNDKEELVYNLIDSELKKTEIKNGKFQGLSPIEIFTRFADMKEEMLHIRDLIKQAITHSVYRVKSNGRFFEGDLEIAKDEDELIKFLMDENHQDDLIMLEQKLKGKKVAEI